MNLDELRIVAERALERRQLLIEHRRYQDTRGGAADMAQRDVLIVDDDRQVREVLHQIFLGAGYKCLLASDGAAGLEAFRGSRPPLIVTGLKMPVMSGIELLEQARQDDPDVVSSSSAALRT